MRCMKAIKMSEILRTDETISNDMSDWRPLAMK